MPENACLGSCPAGPFQLPALLRLEHAGFGPKNAIAFEMMGQGWRGRIGARLGEALAGLP